MNSDTIQLALCGMMPPSFFKSRKVPVAPLRAANLALLFDFSVAVAAFGALFSYYYSITTATTTVSSTLLPGQDCTVLSPRRGVTFYSTNTSENGQFASPFYKKDVCISLLKSHQVCAKSNRYDFLSVLGVSNPANAQYFGSGYFSFSPTQTAGTQLVTLYQSSISFPRPDTARTFPGSDSAWYVYSFNNDSYSEFKDIYFTNTIVDSNYSGSNGMGQVIYSQNGLTQFELTKEEVTVNRIGQLFPSQLGNKLVSPIAVHANDYYSVNTFVPFSTPSALIVDGSGNVFVTVTNANLNSLILRIDIVTGSVSTLGSLAVPPFQSPNGIAVDTKGNVYVADSNNNMIRRIDAITDIASALGSLAVPPFQSPNGIALDTKGNVYVADSNNNMIRRIDAITNIVTTVGPSFNYPYGIAVDSSGNIYISCGGDSSIRRIDTVTGIASILGGTANPGFNNPAGIAVDKAGNIYIADSNNKLLRRIDAITNTVVNVQLNYYLNWIAIDSSDNVYVSDVNENLVRIYDSITESVIDLNTSHTVDPHGIAVDGSGNIYFGDCSKFLVSRIDAITGIVTDLGSSTLPIICPEGIAVDGFGNIYFAGSHVDTSAIRRIDALTGDVINLGLSASPSFSSPFGIAVDGSGNVYVGDGYNNLVRRIDALSGNVISLGLSALPAFSNPQGVAVDSARNVFVADYGNQLFRRIDANTGIVTNIGLSAVPAFNFFSSIALDSFGNVYVGDSNLIRRIDSFTGNVTNFGASAVPPLQYPGGVAVDNFGSIYVSDLYNKLVRKIKATTAYNFGSFWSPVPLVGSLNNSSNASVTKFHSLSIVPPFDQIYIMYEVNSLYDCSRSFRPRRNIVCTNTLVFTEFSQMYQSLLTGFAYNGVLGGAQLTRQPLYVAGLDRSTNLNSNRIPRNSSGPIPYVYIDINGNVDSTIVGVFATPKGTILFTSFSPQPVSVLIGNMSDTDVVNDLQNYYKRLSSDMIHISSYFRNFISIIRASSSVTSSVLPGSPPRFVTLQLISSSDGTQSSVTYDTFTDQYFSPTISANVAATKYMIAYTYGICNGVLTKSVVELSGSLDYSVQCAEQNGLYYQSPNEYYPLPFECFGIPYDKLLTDCPVVAKNMQLLVDSTCAQSIEKVCSTQYNSNPPYTCTSYTRYSILTALSLSFSTTMAIIGFVAVLLTLLLSLYYPNHIHSTNPEHEKEVELVNRGLGQQVVEEIKELKKFRDLISTKLDLSLSDEEICGKEEGKDDTKSTPPNLSKVQELNTESIQISEAHDDESYSPIEIGIDSADYSSITKTR